MTKIDQNWESNSGKLVNLSHNYFFGANFNFYNTEHSFTTLSDSRVRRLIEASVSEWVNGYPCFFSADIYWSSVIRRFFVFGLIAFYSSSSHKILVLFFLSSSDSELGIKAVLGSLFRTGFRLLFAFFCSPDSKASTLSNLPGSVDNTRARTHTFINTFF